MKILVAVKRVIDFATHVRVKADRQAVETANVKMSINPFDEIAVEEAVRLKEQGIATEIIVVTIGVLAAQEIIRSALAMGADKGLLIQTEQELQPLAVAKVLQKICQQESPQLIILGKQAIDTDDNQVGQMLAGLLAYPQATFASKIVVEKNNVKVTREIDGGLQTLSLQLPAVITTDLRLNEPRYLSLPNIVQAKKKPLDIVPLEQLSIDVKPRYKVLQVMETTKQRTKIKVASVQELIANLKDKQVI